MHQRRPVGLLAVSSLLTLTVSGLLTVASVPLAAQPGRTATPIARTAVADGDTVRLGAPLGELARWAVIRLDTLVRVPADRLEDDVDGLLLVRDPDGPVRRIAFLYAESRNIDALVGAHMRDYGRGAVYSSAPVPEGLRENWTWSDGRTSLTLTRFTPSQNGIAAIRQLVDLLPR